ncbi:MAG TPA: hypothetical protein PLL06_16115, partial [Acidobacteriota bacterium]|nr:hypothetical protein [Acidobacteriota bacterium]
MNDKTVLEPLSTGDIIDRALKIYRQNFGAMLGIVAIPGLVTYSGSLLTLLGSSKMAMGGASTVNGGILIVLGYGIALLVGPLLNLLAIGGLSRTVADCVMLDQPIEFRQTLKMIQGRFGQLLAGQ